MPCFPASPTASQVLPVLLGPHEIHSTRKNSFSPPDFSLVSEPSTATQVGLAHASAGGFARSCGLGGDFSLSCDRTSSHLGKSLILGAGQQALTATAQISKIWAVGKGEKGSHRNMEPRISAASLLPPASPQLLTNLDVEEHAGFGAEATTNTSFSLKLPTLGGHVGPIAHPTAGPTIAPHRHRHVSHPCTVSLSPWHRCPSMSPPPDVPSCPLTDTTAPRGTQRLLPGLCFPPGTKWPRRKECRD